MARSRLKITGQKGIKDLFSDKKQQIKKAVDLADSQSIDIGFGVKVNFGKIDSAGLKKKLQDLNKVINAAHKNAIKEVSKALEAALNDAMGDPVWNWTQGTRDIVDTGALRDSLTVYIDSDSDIHIMYNSDYAAIVHYGGYVNPYGNPNITMYYPARPWIDSVLNGGGPVEQFQWEKVYEKAFTTYIARKFK